MRRQEAHGAYAHGGGGGGGRSPMRDGNAWLSAVGYVDLRDLGVVWLSSVRARTRIKSSKYLIHQRSTWDGWCVLGTGSRQGRRSCEASMAKLDARVQAATLRRERREGASISCARCSPCPS